MGDGYYLGRTRTPTIGGTLTVSQLVVVCIAGVIVIAAMTTLPFLAAAIVVVVVALVTAGLIAFPVGPLGMSAAAMGAVAARFGLRRALGEGKERSLAPQTGRRPGERAEVKAPKAMRGLEIVPVKLESGEVGVVVERRKGTYTAVLLARSREFALLGQEAQHMRLGEWGEVLSHLGREGTPVSRAAWLERAVPAGSNELADHLRSHRDPDLELDSPVVGSYVDLISRAGQTTQDHEVYLVIQVSRKRGRTRIARLGGKDEGGAKVAVQELHSAAQLLQDAGIAVLGGLSSERLRGLIRNQLDPFGEAARIRAATRNGDFGMRSEKEGLAEDPWPMATDEHWSHVRCDRSMHATYWVSSWPKVEVGATFLSPLLMGTPFVRTLAVVMEPEPPSKALARAERESTSEAAEDVERQKKQIRTSYRRKREVEAVAQREAELADNHPECRFTGYLTVTAQDEDTLELIGGAAENSAKEARLDLRLMHGQQAEALSYTLPFCRGLR